MCIIKRVSSAMQEILIQAADRLGKELGFIQRQRQFTGSTFVQTLVFTWLSNPNASLEEFAQTSHLLEVPITPQAIDQRFNEKAILLLKELLNQAIQLVIEATPAPLPILQRFSEVIIQDSSFLALPVFFKDLFPACGNQHFDEVAGLKLHVRWNWTKGNFATLEISPARSHDQTAFKNHSLPKGSLRLADLGYFNLKEFRHLNEEGVYWLSRLNAGVNLFTEEGEELDLLEFLKKQSAESFECKVLLGANERLKARMFVQKAPEDVVRKRHKRIYQEAQKRCHEVSPRSLELAKWMVLVSNIPEEMLTLEESFIVYRVRWQIELLFKLWKSQGQLKNCRSEKPERILCEIYGKLLTAVIQNWLLLIGVWSQKNRSLEKGAKFIQKHSMSLLMNLSQKKLLQKVLKFLEKGLSRCCIGRRKKNPHTYQLLTLTS